MKRLASILATLSLLVSVLLPAIPVHAENTNLIANPSVETVSGANLTDWTANNWGSNTATLTHENVGQDGNKSLRINMTAHAGGDAKWMHTPISVDGNTSYTYTSYYKSNVDTEIDLQYTDTSGNISYEYVQHVPAGTDWAALSATFTTPANVAQVVVMHIIAAPGWLQTDNFSLAETVVAPPPVDTENLIANPSMETANGDNPQHWINNTWGANSGALLYETTGRTGSRSVTTAITGYSDGDAKWYAAPVDVAAGKNYLYRDYFKATVPTRVVVAFIDANNTYSYHEVAGAAAASDWTLYETTFTAPSTAVKASVFHLIDRVGTLTIDDVMLQVALPSGNISIANSSVENGTSTPNNWQSSKWGTNNATFEYATNEGQAGNRSVKVTMNNYADGDAKWYFNPISTLTPGGHYRFTAWYKGTVAPQVVAMYVMADGSEHYVGLPSPQTASTTWTKYTDTFTVPEGATATSVFMYVNANGWLQTDNYSIGTYTPNGFIRGLVTLTFDDGHEENTETALPIMDEFGFKSTQCYATTFIEGLPQTVIDGVMEFYDGGHEICSHTVTHPFLTTLNTTNLTYELQHSQEYLETLIGEPVRNFASPYGDYNASVNDIIDNYYQSHRTVDEGFNSKDNFDTYRLRVQNILDTTSAAQVQEWVDQAYADKTWLILVYHRVANDPGAYDTTPELFQAQMEAVAASGIAVKTWQAVLDELLPQL